MKPVMIFLSGLLCFTKTLAQSKNNDWENPQLYEQNKEKPHAAFMLFDKKQDVADDDYSRSPFYKSLNGTWKFVYVDKYANRPPDFYRADLDDSRWTWSYIRPQEGGYKTDVRWLSLTNSDGRGLLVEGLQPVCFSAINNPAEDLDPGLTKKQQHPTDIKPRNNVYLNIDLKQRGAGGDNSWGALPHDQYRLPDKKYSYSYVMRLIDK